MPDNIFARYSELDFDIRHSEVAREIGSRCVSKCMLGRFKVMVACFSCSSFWLINKESMLASPKTAPACTLRHASTQSPAPPWNGEHGYTCAAHAIQYFKQKPRTIAHHNSMARRFAASVSWSFVTTASVISEAAWLREFSALRVLLSSWKCRYILAWSSRCMLRNTL